MSTRAVLLPMLLASVCSSLLTLALAALAFPPASRAAPDQQPPAPVVRAQRFEVVDASGAVVATLGVEPERSTGLFIMDAAGQQRAGLAVGVNGQAFAQVFTPQGAPQLAGAILQAGPDGSVTIAAVDMQARAALGLAPDGAASMQITSSTGQPLWQVEAP